MELGDAYRVLRVQEGAPEEVVRAAFRALSKKTHPDTGGTATEFRSIEEAFLAIERAGFPDRPMAPSADGRPSAPASPAAADTSTRTPWTQRATERVSSEVGYVRARTEPKRAARAQSRAQAQADAEATTSARRARNRSRKQEKADLRLRDPKGYHRSLAIRLLGSLALATVLCVLLSAAIRATDPEFHMDVPLLAEGVFQVETRPNTGQTISCDRYEQTAANIAARENLPDEKKSELVAWIEAECLQRRDDNSSSARLWLWIGIPVLTAGFMLVTEFTSRYGHSSIRQEF